MKKAEENIFKVFMIIAALIIIGLLLFILGTIILKGVPALSWNMITKLPGGGFYLGREGGVLNAIVGSLYVIAGAVAISIVISLPLVMYINFYLPHKSPLAGIVRFSFDILLGVPSIVYGAFGFALMIFLGMRASLAGGIITVAMLITPIMMRSFDEATKLMPRDLPDSLLSLGSTKYEMIKVIMRQLMPGFVTAALLATGRGIGDAATVLFTAGYTDNLPGSLSQPAATLPLSIFFQLGSPVAEVQNRAYASALILTFLILILSFAARYFSSKFSRNRL
ncbi:MAG: ABC transporter permease subunit [Bacteroidales bacterium]|jgi:phosphate transport system permease protein|nr:ABC transporter permease subunit [Bacteroidales bacterium]